ncbi:hypothetical protein CMI37_16785 [Candidatus Pacearchaeota archaeon]|nr:hypothetical protein [Candidatus Pacearchaeota archaeon]
MTQESSGVAQLGEDIGKQLQSFVSLLESVGTQDAELAEVLADDFANRMRISYQKLFVEMTSTISVELAKDPSKRLKPKKKRGRKRKIDSAPIIAAPMTDLERRQALLDSERGVGVEELEDNSATSIVQNVENEDDIAGLLERTVRGGGPTSRASVSETTSWDTENPTMRRIKE